MLTAPCIIFGFRVEVEGFKVCMGLLLGNGLVFLTITIIISVPRAPVS